MRLQFGYITGFEIEESEEERVKLTVSLDTPFPTCRPSNHNLRLYREVPSIFLTNKIKNFDSYTYNLLSCLSTVTLSAATPSYFRGFTLIALKENREGDKEEDHAGTFQVRTVWACPVVEVKNRT